MLTQLTQWSVGEGAPSQVPGTRPESRELWYVRVRVSATQDWVWSPGCAGNSKQGVRCLLKRNVSFPAQQKAVPLPPAPWGGEHRPSLPLPKVTTGPLLTMASPWEGAVTSRNENHGLGHPVAIHRARSAEISGRSGA